MLGRSAPSIRRADGPGQVTGDVSQKNIAMLRAIRVFGISSVLVMFAGILLASHALRSGGSVTIDQLAESGIHLLSLALIGPSPFLVVGFLILLPYESMKELHWNLCMIGLVVSSLYLLAQLLATTVNVIGKLPLGSATALIVLVCIISTVVLSQILVVIIQKTKNGLTSQCT